MMLQPDSTILAMIMAVGGVPVTHAGGSFFAIFDREFLLVSGTVESRVTALTARTSDVKDLPESAVLTIADDVSGENLIYRIKRHEPDGTGVTVVVLKH